MQSQTKLHGKASVLQVTGAQHGPGPMASEGVPLWEWSGGEWPQKCAFVGVEWGDWPQRLIFVGGGGVGERSDPLDRPCVVDMLFTFVAASLNGSWLASTKASKHPKSRDIRSLVRRADFPLASIPFTPKSSLVRLPLSIHPFIH